MARYYFNTVDGGTHRDDEGEELANDQAARTEAIRYAAGLAGDRPDLLKDEHVLRVEVLDGGRELVSTVVILAVDAPRAWREG